MKKTINQILAELHKVGPNEEIELWILFSQICASMGLNERQIPTGEAEKIWVHVSELITKMLQTGFVAVDLADKGSYIAWPEQGASQVLAKIKTRWLELKGKFPDVGFIVWFLKPAE